MKKLFVFLVSVLLCTTLNAGGQIAASVAQQGNKEKTEEWKLENAEMKAKIAELEEKIERYSQIIEELQIWVYKRELNSKLSEQQNRKDYEALEQTIIEAFQIGVPQSLVLLNNLGFAQLCNQKYDEAKISLQAALDLNPNYLLAIGNLGNYFLLTGSYEQAITLFKEHKNKKINGNKKFKKTVSDDLKEFERLGLKNSDFDKVRKELKIK